MTLRHALSCLTVPVVLVLLAGCGGSTPAPSRPAPAAPAPRVVDTRIRYEVDGANGMLADLTIATPTGTSQQQDVTIPLHAADSTLPGLEFTYRPGAFVYISAQNKGEYGSLTCRIVEAVSNRVIAENTASGAYAIASCNGNAP